MMTAADETAERLASAALTLVEERGWPQLSMAEAAERAGVSLADAHQCFPDKTALLAWLMGATDRHVLSHGLADGEEMPRDRLFEVLMRRFDALQPRRSGLVAILRELPRDPLPAIGLLPQFAVSLAWMLEAAGVSASGPLGLLRVKAIGAVYLNALRAWINDDTPDMAPTMAALDSGLRRAEQLARGLPGPLQRAAFGKTASPSAAAPPPAAPA